MTAPAVSTAAPIAAAPPDAKPPAGEQIKDRRHRGFWPAAERTANTVFLFYFNPVLDPDTNRISGTRLLAWIVVAANVLDIVESHRLKELEITKGVNDAISWKNVALFAIAFGIWFGPKGMTWAVDLVNAWKGHPSSAGGTPA